MAAYLRFYQFDASPFESSNQKRAMVLGTRSLRGAFEQVKNGLTEDSPRICLSGSGGVGKTSFCRALPRLLGDSAKVALVLNPRRPWREIRDTIAKKFDLVGGAISRRALLDAGGETKQLVLVIDEAEFLSHESLDHLDILLQYKRDDGRQLLHCVMLANLDSAASGTEIPLLWWLDKLTTLQLQFSPIPLEGLRHYVEKHLAKAGWAGGELFTEDALEAIHLNTGGLPRAINELCEKILMEGGVRGLTSISSEFIEELCGDTSAPKIGRPEIANPEVSADFSISDFGTSPSAQQLLDASDPEPVSYEEERVAPDSAYFESRPPELQSLILNQDSDEALEVESTPAKNKTEEPKHSLTIELEDDPTAPDNEPEFHGRRPVGMVVRNRSVVEPRRKKGYGGKLFLVACAIAAGFWINTHFSSPADLIDRAEGKITKALDRKPSVVTATNNEAVAVVEDTVTSVIQEVDVEPTEHRSLIDRADEIAAATGLDSLPLPEVDELAGEDAATNALTAQETDVATAEAVSPEQPQTKPAAIPALRPAPKDVAVTQPQQQVKVTKVTPPTSSSEVKTPVVAVVKSKSNAKVSDELVVINEYVAIPEAADSVPRLAIPGTAKTTPDPAPKRSVAKLPSADPKQQRASMPTAQTTTTVPAKLDSAPAVEPAGKTLPAVQPVKQPVVEPTKKPMLDEQASSDETPVETSAAGEAKPANVAEPAEVPNAGTEAAATETKPETPETHAQASAPSTPTAAPL